MRPSRQRSTSRRSVLRGFAAGLAGASFPQWPSVGFAQRGISVNELGGGLFVVTAGDTNSVVLTTDEGQIVVDTAPAASSDAVIATLGELPGDRVAAVFNTHWHLDRVGGNESLGAAGATIFAHEKTRQRLTAGYYRPSEDAYVAPLPAAALPTETIYDRDDVEIGAERIDYGYLIEAHTDGDIYVSFPDRNVIAVGDVMSPVRDPEFDWFGGGWLGGRLDSLALLLALSDTETRFVPGVGPVIGRAEVQTEHDSLTELFERIVVHIRLGATPKDMLDEGVLDGLGREFSDPYKLLYDLHKGFWAHHNKLMHDIV